MNFVDLVYQLQDMGIADVLLPFILVFTVVFAVLQKSQLFGELYKGGDKTQPTGVKRFNVIVALVMGAGIVFPHVLRVYPPYADPVTIINSSLPNVAVVIIAVIMVMLLLGAFGTELDFRHGSLPSVVFFFSMIVIIYIFGTSAGFFGGGNFPPWLWFLADPNTQALIVMILIFGIIIHFITKEDKKPENPPKQKYGWVKTIGGP